jgi:hypothetical protein
MGAIDFKTNIAGIAGLFAPTGRSYGLPKRECRAVESETCPDRFQLPPRHYFALRAARAVPAPLKALTGFVARR